MDYMGCLKNMGMNNLLNCTVTDGGIMDLSLFCWRLADLILMKCSSYGLFGKGSCSSFAMVTLCHGKIPLNELQKNLYTQVLPFVLWNWASFLVVWYRLIDNCVVWNGYLRFRWLILILPMTIAIFWRWSQSFSDRPKSMIFHDSFLTFVFEPDGRIHLWLFKSPKSHGTIPLWRDR